jgi:pimeloyl-ACP methyl ester carboxylesterase
VRGVAAVSGPTRRHRGITPDFTAIADQMVAEGRGRDLMPAEPWSRSYSPPKPGPVSAQTYLSWARSNLDVFGLDTLEPAIAAIRCPLFACYGTNEAEIGTPDDLGTIRKNARASTGVETKVFEGCGHAYAGHEMSLADALANWISTLT